MIKSEIFKNYDIRAVAGKELDAEGVRRVAQAVFAVFGPKSIQVGRDMRVTSEEYQAAFIDELLGLGVSVVDLGLVSTDMLFFASGKYEEDMAITISASHNPKEFNGMKLVKRGAVPVSGDNGIFDIRDVALSDREITYSGARGELGKRDVMEEWIEHLLNFIDLNKMKNFDVVVDTGNGMAGHFMPELEKHMPWKVHRLFYELDGTFPNHPASPIEEENMQDVVNTVKETSADIGMAFDGDGDRVFLVDEKGVVINGTVMTAIIADNMLAKRPSETVLYNAIVGRVVPEVVSARGGESIRVRVGHSYIKADMREHNAIFAGEHSGHYFFRENYYADSAIIAALLVLEQMSVTGKKLSELAEQYGKYFSSGEINFRVNEKEEIMKNIETEYSKTAKSKDRLDGVTIWFDDWWVNVRPSNTEPFLRLNVEADSKEILEQRKKELVEFIEARGGKLE